MSLPVSSLRRLTYIGNNTRSHRLQQAVPRSPKTDICVRPQEAHNREGGFAAPLVQRVAYGRWHRSAQDPAGTRKEGPAARRGASVPARPARPTGRGANPGGERTSPATECTSVLVGTVPACLLKTSMDNFAIVSYWLPLLGRPALTFHILHLRQRHDASLGFGLGRLEGV